VLAPRKNETLEVVTSKKKERNCRRENEVRNIFRDIRRDTRRCVVKEFSGMSSGEKEMRKLCLGNVRKAG